MIGNSSPFFFLLCRLAQLIKGVRRSAGAKDALTDDAPEGSASASASSIIIEQATNCENDITAWLAELPAAYRLNMDLDVMDPLVQSPSTPPSVMAQRCELSIAANRVVLKLYLPYLKESISPSPSSSSSASGSSGSAKPSHHAVLGAINAAHAIIYASRIFYSLWKDSRPAMLLFYD